MSSVTADPAIGAESEQSQPARLAEIALLVVALAATVCWAVLYRWYGLLENRNNTHFAFEKVSGSFDSPIIRRTLSLFIVLAIIYALGYWILRSAPRISPLLKAGIAGSVLGPGVINVLLYPVGALDVFNYLIELKLTYVFDRNPYVETFEQFRHDPFALPAFLVNTPLFYGPVWLIGSGLPGLIVGYDDVIRLLIATKIFNFVLLAITAVAIAIYQDSHRLRWLAVYAFLANPLILFEGVGNAHNDVLMTVLLIGALLALQRRWTATGPLLAASALVKFFTGVLAPIFLAVIVIRRWGLRRLALAGGLTVATIVLSTAPFWADGKMLDGLREGTKASQEMNHVSVYSLAQQYEREREIDRLLAKQPRTMYAKQYLAARQLSPDAKDRLQRIFMGVFAIAALILLFGVTRDRPLEAAAVDTLILFCLLLTNLYPWYLIPIFAVLALRRGTLGTVYLMGATALGLAYYPFYVWAHFNSGWEKFHVHLFLAIFLTLPMLVFLAAELGGWGIGVLRSLRTPAAEPASETRWPLRRRRANAS